MTARFASTLLIGLCLASPAAAIDGDRLRVIDGDTLRLGRERLRLLDIDAPEINPPRCVAELELGLLARARLAALIAGRQVEIRRHGRDRYRRPLVRLTVGGEDVGAILLEDGLALTWMPGRAAYEARRAHWCGGRP